MATQAERRTATRHRLVTVARQHFASEGYDQTSTERIRQQAGVSRGAMYHHFASKQAIFEAVFQDVSTETIRNAVGRARAGTSPLENLIASCLAWLEEVQRPPVAAILLDQGPYVLGWRHARELEAQTSLGLMTSALEAATAAGEIDVVSIPVTAKLLNAILAEAALIALNDDTITTSSLEIEGAIRQFITGLTTTSGDLAGTAEA